MLQFLQEQEQPCLTQAELRPRSQFLTDPTLALFQCPASQEKLEENLQPVRRRENPELPGPGVCPSPLQTHPSVFHGRDRRRPRLQKRLHRGILHLCKFLRASLYQDVPSPPEGVKWPHRAKVWDGAVLLLPLERRDTSPKPISCCQNTPKTYTKYTKFPQLLLMSP